MLDVGLRNVISSPMSYGKEAKKTELVFCSFLFLMKEPSFLFRCTERNVTCVEIEGNVQALAMVATMESSRKCKGLWRVKSSHQKSLIVKKHEEQQCRVHARSSAKWG